jgi:hypothetical protein
VDYVEHAVGSGRFHNFQLFESVDSPRVVLKELEIMKATTSDCMLNIVHNINPLYRIPHSVQDQTTAHADTADDTTKLVKALYVLPTI